MRFAAAALLAVLLAGCGSAQTGILANFDPDPVYPIGAISDATSHKIAKLDRVASTLAGRHAIVNCWSVKSWNELEMWRTAHHFPADIEGVTYPRKHRIQLSPFICEVLAQVLARSANQPLYTAEGVTVLAHESAHVSGIAAENRAECHAIETDTRAGRLLGLSESVAAELPHVYRGSIYPYDDVKYRTPACRAGLPGAVIPDTLGSAAELQPLARIGAAVEKSLRGWTNLEGASRLGPLSPCAPIRSRTTERLRFGESFAGPGGEFLEFTSVRFKTKAVFAQSRTGQAKAQRCDIALDNRLAREEHLPWKFSAWPLPKQFARLSPNVQGFRAIQSDGTRLWIRDSIFIFDSPTLGQTSLFFRLPSSTPIGQELRTVKAALHASR